MANYYSSSISVIRDVTGIEESRQPLFTDRLPLEIYPSLAKSAIHVRVRLSEKEIKVYDISGKLIKKIATPSARNDNPLVFTNECKGRPLGLRIESTLSKIKKVRNQPLEYFSIPLTPPFIKGEIKGDYMKTSTSQFYVIL